MRISEISKTLLKKHGYSQRGYAEAAGVSLGSVYNCCARDNCKVDTLVGMLEPLGYELAVVPRAAKLPDEHYVIERGRGKDDPIDDRRTGSHVKIHGGDSDELIG